MIIVRSNIRADSTDVQKYYENLLNNERAIAKFNVRILKVNLEKHYLFMSFIGDANVGYIEAYFLTDKSVDEEYKLLLKQARVLRKNGYVNVKALEEYDYEITCQYDGDFNNFQIVEINVIQESYEKNVFGVLDSSKQKKEERSWRNRS